MGTFRGWSDMFWFQSLPAGSEWTPRIGVFGDLGNKNGISIGPLQVTNDEEFADYFTHTCVICMILEKTARILRTANIGRGSEGAFRSTLACWRHGLQS